MKGAALSVSLHAFAIACLAMVAEAPPPLPSPPIVTVAWLPPTSVAVQQTARPANQPALPQPATRISRHSSPSPATDRPRPAVPPVSTAAPEPLTEGADAGETAPTRASATSIGPTREAQYELGAIDTPLPNYPWSARRRNREGRVVVRLMVAADGTVLSAEVQESSGDATLDGAARDALSGWRLRPALANGTPVATHIDVPIRFELRLQARL